MAIRNTRKIDTAEAAMILADARSGGKWGPSAIEEMEREGKAQLMNSDRLPVQAEAQVVYEALGFTFGEPDKNDPMFRPATFPEGWSRKGSDHAMWSYIADEHGRDRVSIFYKAAFYDRDAFMRLVSLSSYVATSVEHDGGPVIFDDQWATREAVAAAMTEIRDAELKEAADFRGYATDAGRRDEKNREDCARIAGEREATAAKYGTALAALTES
jgi:hypothetical protein